MDTALIGERLTQELSGGPPGHDDFRELSGYARPDIASIIKQQPPPRESAVLILLYPDNGELNTLLILRPEYDGVHSGQVAFPGGHREASDKDLRATALREFTEETGAAHEAFTVIGELTQVYIPPSRSLVTPVLALTDRVPHMKPDPREVQRVISVPIPHVLRDDIMKRTRMFVRAIGRELDVPYWDVEGQVVWGATALMIAELRDLLTRGGITGRSA